MQKFTNWEIFNQCKNIKLTELKKEKLQLFYDLMITENKKYNLTRITEMNEAFEKHFVDSLLFTNEIKLDKQKIADIGSGAGFPGIVLKIFYPDLQMTLIESNNKKANFLRLAIKSLDLHDVEVSAERAEEFSLNHKEEFDIVVSRAVAYLDIILEIGVQMLKVDGQFILLKGPRADEEIKNSKDVDKKLGLELVNKQILNDQNIGTRVNLFYEKIKPTDKKYPRKFSIIKKESGQNVQQ